MFSLPLYEASPDGRWSAGLREPGLGPRRCILTRAPGTLRGLDRPYRRLLYLSTQEMKVTTLAAAPRDVVDGGACRRVGRCPPRSGQDYRHGSALTTCGGTNERTAMAMATISASAERICAIAVAHFAEDGLRRVLAEQHCRRGGYEEAVPPCTFRRADRCENSGRHLPRCPPNSLSEIMPTAHETLLERNHHV